MKNLHCRTTRERSTLAAWGMGAALVAAEAVVSPEAGAAPACDGSELLCLSLSSAAEVEGAGGQIVGGSFTGGGFRPSDRGGIDWDYGPSVDLSSGRISFDVTGLLPTVGGDTGGGKRALFQFLGFDGVEHTFQLQKMAEDYRDGHIFRMGLDDDGLADNWDAAIITGSGFPCGVFSIAGWGPNETHHFDIAWSAAGLRLDIDDWPCSTRGNNDDLFDPAYKTFTLGNRVEHFPAQHAAAVFRNLRLWAASGGEPPPPPPPPPPGAIRVNPAHDATVARGEQGDPDTSYGFAPELQVGADGMSLPDEVTFFAFNIPTLPGTVTSAALHLTAFDGGGAQSLYLTSDLLRDSNVRWNEQNLTWNDAPLPVPGVVDSVGSVAAGQRPAFDVTSLVRSGERLAVMLVSSAPDATGYRSREHGTAADRPYLELFADPTLFDDDFESGDFDRWNVVAP